MNYDFSISEACEPLFRILTAPLNSGVDEPLTDRSRAGQCVQ